MKLEILICTHGLETIKRLAYDRLPQIDGVGYLISWQVPEGAVPAIPDGLLRSDVRVVVSGKTGVSNNRNNCLDHARGPLCLMSDDDLTFYPDGIRAVIDAFHRWPSIDFAMFQYTGADNKLYPLEEYDIVRKLAKNHFVTEFEIAFRLEPIRRSGVRFNPNFGVGGTDYLAGEGPLWVHGLLQKGLKGRFFPIDVVNHPGLTTAGDEGAKPEVLRSDGAYIAVAYPLTAIPRVLLLAWRRGRRFGVSPLRCARYVMQGYLRAAFHPETLGLK